MPMILLRSGTRPAHTQKISQIPLLFTTLLLFTQTSPKKVIHQARKTPISDNCFILYHTSFRDISLVEDIQVIMM